MGDLSDVPLNTLPAATNGNDDLDGMLTTIAVSKTYEKMGLRV